MSPDGKPACVSTRILTDSARKRIVSESYAEIFINSVWNSSSLPKITKKA